MIEKLYGRDMILMSKISKKLNEIIDYLNEGENNTNPSDSDIESKPDTKTIEASSPEVVKEDNK